LSDYAPVVPSLAVSLAVLLVSCAAAAPDSSRRFFPLEANSEWTFEDTNYGGTSIMSVTRARAGVFQLDGFPGAPDLRVRWSGQTVQAWDDSQRRWEALLRLGAPAGTTYRVDLPAQFWNGVRVTVDSWRATVPNPVLRRSHKGAVRLAVRPPAELSDGGVTGLWFAPRIGLVRWVEESIAGPVVHVLSSARIGGKTIVKRP
jgi:hypothetical protein